MSMINVKSEITSEPICVYFAILSHLQLALVNRVAVLTSRDN